MPAAENEVRNAGGFLWRKESSTKMAGRARTFANLLGDTEGEESLQQSLDEESATDKKLIQLAEDIDVEAE